MGYHTQGVASLCPGLRACYPFRELTLHDYPQDMLLHIALCCLEGSTLSNLVHRRRRCARIVLYTILCLEGSTPEDRLYKTATYKVKCFFLFIALRWMQRPERVMVGLTENIQACLRIFRRAQHQWLVRDILHPTQGVFAVFVLH